MKLFLSSMAVSPEQAPSLAELVGKTLGETKFLLIENAADVYEGGGKGFVYANRKLLESSGITPEFLDLNDYRGSPEKLRETASGYDIIWLGGGNTYYLRWLLRETGLDVIIKDLVADGVVYGGGSAGAIVAGPTLKHFEDADHPEKAPKIIMEGLGLTKFVMVPHWENEKFGSIMKSAQEALEEDGYETVPITDAQAVVISGDDWEVIPK